MRQYFLRQTGNMRQSHFIGGQFHRVKIWSSKISSWNGDRKFHREQIRREQFRHEKIRRYTVSPLDSFTADSFAAKL